MKAVWEVYQQDTTLPDGTVVTGEQAGVNRLRSVRERERATQELAQVQALFDAAKTEMQRAQAADPANRAAIQRAYEENVFPALRAQIAMIEGSGLLELYGSSDTGQ
jgi:nitrogen fixation/metabolism regulation signal transduction histidine kinase